LLKPYRDKTSNSRALQTKQGRVTATARAICNKNSGKIPMEQGAMMNELLDWTIPNNRSITGAVEEIRSAMPTQSGKARE